MGCNTNGYQSNHHLLNMSPSLPEYYDKLILKQPWRVLLVITLVCIVSGWYATDFKLDASAETLVLEHDESLQYYRSIRARYGADDYLIVTYTPKYDLFDAAALADLDQLRSELETMERVESITSLLDVPLISSPPVTLAELDEEIRTLKSPATDIELARHEFVSSHLYRNLIISTDGQTTALQVNFKRDETYYRLLDQRDRLREMRLTTGLSDKEADELDRLSREFNEYRASMLKQQDGDIAIVRALMDKHRGNATLYLGGVPMIVADSIEFIRHDLVTFGAGVLCFIIFILAIAFHRLRWILLPIATCFATALIMIGFLGLIDWPVTVVSSNFISLLLILTLSFAIHLIVRYRELHAANHDADMFSLVQQTIRSKAMPCFYTATTTMVAFGSLLFSGIRPVIDFGWMMAIGTVVAFILTFTLFPALLMLLKPGHYSKTRNLTALITTFIAHLIKRHRATVPVVFIVITIWGIVGISMLTVENRFIDYFKESTEIYRGMELIDRKLGGTTPLDVIIDAPADFFEPDEEAAGGETDDEVFKDDFDEEFEGSAGFTASSYWFNTYKLEEAGRIHDYLDGLTETGKVLSISTVIRMLDILNEGKPVDDFFLAILYKRMPDGFREALFSPYLSEDGHQLRFSIRVFESDPSLKREELLQKIQHHLTGEMGLQKEQVHVTGMLVLYNNMLQSLFSSQIQTLGAVFLAIMLMFVVSFRSLKLAAIAIVPNLVAAILVLGLMGWLNIPLDIMTITIAAIVIGIAVDDAIHYVHRFKKEFRRDCGYWTSVERCHDSIGRAMYYTSITITLGFIILALSNFIPTIYFGLLTGFSMLVAMIANLTLLPIMIVWFRPMGPCEIPEPAEDLQAPG
jgi:predicted RND superfamily exporter protein